MDEELGFPGDRLRAERAHRHERAEARLRAGPEGAGGPALKSDWLAESRFRSVGFTLRAASCRRLPGFRAGAGRILGACAPSIAPAGALHSRDELRGRPVLVKVAGSAERIAMSRFGRGLAF